MGGTVNAAIAGRSRVSSTALHFLWSMRPYYRQVAGELVLGSICGAVMNTAIVLPPLLLGRSIDQVLAFSRGESSSSAVAVAALLLVAGQLASELPRIGKRWWIMTANQRIRASLRIDVFRGTVAWPMARLHVTPIGDLIARAIGDVDVVWVGVREFTTETWDTVLYCISILVAMVVLDSGLTALVILPMPLALLLAHFSGRWIASRTTASRQVNAQLTASIQEHLIGVRVVRLFGRREAAIDQVAQLSDKQARANLALMLLTTGLQPIYATLITAGIVAIVWLGGQHVLAGGLTLGAFVAYLDLFGRFVARSPRIPQLVNSIQSGAAAYVRLEPLLAPPLGIQGEAPFATLYPNHLVGMRSRWATSRQLAKPGAAAVSIRNATFTYPGSAEPAFRELSLDIAPGSVVAITGPVGSGKSALARCLAGLYAPESGAILVDGVYAHRVAPGTVGYAPQDGYVFSGSVRENVFLSTNGAGDPPESLLRFSEMDRDVAALPHGADSAVGERGIRISGGQRQRLGLARAAAARWPATPGLLVLDDPFSAVDVDTEARLVANVRDAFGPGTPDERRATVVLFSHRLGAFPQADFIVVLDRGRVVECGTHVALLEQNGLYGRIYRSQQRTERAALSGSSE